MPLCDAIIGDGPPSSKAGLSDRGLPEKLALPLLLARLNVLWLPSSWAVGRANGMVAIVSLARLAAKSFET